jgi:hypothetical protein
MPDEMFRGEVQAMKATGRNIHLIDTESLTSGPARTRPTLDPGTRVVYRGWMLTKDEYVNLAASVERAGGSCFTLPEQYVATHHLPNWYPIVKDYTPEIVFLDTDADLVSELRRLGWERFFIKDHVKSLKTSVGPIVDDPRRLRHLPRQITLQTIIDRGFGQLAEDPGREVVLGVAGHRGLLFPRPRCAAKRDKQY